MSSILNNLSPKVKTFWLPLLLTASMVGIPIILLADANALGLCLILGLVAIWAWVAFFKAGGYEDHLELQENKRVKAFFQFSVAHMGLATGAAIGAFIRLMVLWLF